jgi:hypothetical protein
MAQNHPILIDIGEGLSMMLGMPTILTWKTKDRPKEPKQGTFGFNSKTGNLEYWDGSDWYSAKMSEGEA